MRRLGCRPPASRPRARARARGSRCARLRYACVREGIRRHRCAASGGAPPPPARAVAAPCRRVGPRSTTHCRPQPIRRNRREELHHPRRSPPRARRHRRVMRAHRGGTPWARIRCSTATASCRCPAAVHALIRVVNTCAFGAPPPSTSSSNTRSASCASCGAHESIRQSRVEGDARAA